MCEIAIAEAHNLKQDLQWVWQDKQDMPTPRLPLQGRRGGGTTTTDSKHKSAAATTGW